MGRVYRDEIILAKREELKKQKYVTLENGFYVQGKVLKFNEKDLFDSFSIALPDIMRVMPIDLARIKYPSEFRPEIIYTTLDLCTNMGFSILWEGLQDQNVKSIAGNMMAAIHRSNADFLIYGLKNMSKIGGCYFAFRSHAMDVDIYNMVLIVPVGNNLIQSNFNCLFRHYKDWLKVVKLMWGSIKEINNGEKF